MNNRIAFLNGDFIEEKKASLHISDLSIQRGYGVFDYCRTSENSPVYIKDHINRFFNSAMIMHLEMPVSKEELDGIITKLMEKNNISDSGIRMLLTGGYSPDSYEIVEPNLLVLQHPLVLRAPGTIQKGIKVITHEYVREFPQAKTINYSMGIWLQQKIKQNNATDVLYHQNGEVSEFPRSNFFIVTPDNIIATPKNNILHGVTRMKILELARKEFTVEERTVTLAEIYTAQEAFMTSTTRRILPITMIDDKVIGNGESGSISNFLEKALGSREKLQLS